MRYKHTQYGVFFILAFCALIGVAFYMLRAYSNVPSEKLWALYMTAGVFTLSLLLFFALTVTIDDEKVKMFFGTGLIFKKFMLKDIQRVEVVKNKWWYGWGIRKVPRGWMFNISGLDAVELTLKNGKVWRIGSEYPKQLKEAIDQAITETKSN